MRIVFVRHGHPDYEKDCLTELGHKHAEAVAERLADEKPTRIFSSTCGRAYETAEHIAAKLGLSIEKCDFMREIVWGSLNGEKIHRNGHPWYVADDMIADGERVMNPNWEKEEPYSNNLVVSSVQKVCEGFDAWLETLGYKREGAYYRVVRNNPDTVFMVSHGGSSSAALAHIFNIPFPHFCAMVRPGFTAITVITLSGEAGKLITPQIEVLTDSRHIERINTEVTFSR